MARRALHGLQTYPVQPTYVEIAGTVNIMLINEEKIKGYHIGKTVVQSHKAKSIVELMFEPLNLKGAVVQRSGAAVAGFAALKKSLVVDCFCML